MMNMILLAQRREIYNKALPAPLNMFSGGFFLGNLISLIIDLFLIVGTLVAFFMLLYGAILWMTSGGDKAKLETARSKITFALIGLFILFASFAIIKIIEQIFGITLLGTINIPTLKP